MHKLTAGSGYDYLTRQVAALDATDKGHIGLAVLLHRTGRVARGVGRFRHGRDRRSGRRRPGDRGADAALCSACGLHPLAEPAAAAAGRPGPDCRRDVAGRRCGWGRRSRSIARCRRPFRVEVAKRIAASQRRRSGCRRTRSVAGGGPGADPDRGGAGVLPSPSMAATRWMPGSWPGRSRRVAASDADGRRFRLDVLAGEVGVDVVGGRRPAVAAAIERGASGRGRGRAEVHRGARLVHPDRRRKGSGRSTSRGLVAAAFTHRDSRAGDPDLHTHVAVANKVQTLDGRWLSIDGRVLFKAKVAASET